MQPTESPSSALTMPRPDARVIVTGSEGGLGRALVNALCASGAAVCGVDRPASGAAVEADLTEPDHCALAVERAAHRLGGIDAVVGAAGVVDTVHRAATFPAASFRADLDANLSSQFFVAQAAYEHLRASSAASIVMVSSLAGLDGLVGQVSYAAAKAGIVGVVRSLAAEWVGDGIRVNGVAPGLFATPKVMGLPDATRDRILRAVPMARLASLDEVVGPILYLLSRAASYVTGQILRIDGGAGLGVHGLHR
jgi:NAD(P)-dependent dehydrogenase (short-subunit alcohol dehydrogenase family)